MVRIKSKIPIKSIKFFASIRRKEGAKDAESTFAIIVIFNERKDV